jgi:hypothetical protein
MAVSDKPMLTAADTAGAPQFESGVWLMPDKGEEAGEPPCAVDVAQPVSSWPRCAGWALYQGGTWFERDGETGIATKPVAASVEVAGGDIALVQIRFDDPDGDLPSEGTPPEPPAYFFAAFDHKPVDASARLRSVELWIVMCGIEKPQAPGADDDAPRELLRFAGFDEECRPDSVAALRAAAEKSRAPDTKLARLRWARATLD